MNKIKEIVNDNYLLEQKEKLLKNRLEIIHLKKLISDLKINYNVAKYAYLVENENPNNELLKELEKDSNVEKYLVLDKKLKELELEIVNYYYFIQTELIDQLKNIDYPDIYIYYGMLENNEIFKNIIDSNITTDIKNKNLILPIKNKESKRKSRHFYNKTKFKYLESLISDNSFSLEEKKLGKVKILKK